MCSYPIIAYEAELRGIRPEVIKGTDLALAQQLTAIWQEWIPQQPMIGAAIKVPPQKLQLDEDIKKSLRSLGYL